MKSTNIIVLGIIQAININLAFMLFPKAAWSLECPFNSYIILDGKCIKLSQESNTNTNTVHKTNYRYNSENNNRAADNLPKKTCKDFEYQHTAQSYFDINSEHKSKFDLDNDGYVCEKLARVRGNILTIKIWQTLMYENRQRKIDTDNKKSLTLSEVNSIIGFSPKQKKATGRHVWEDPISNKRIEIKFYEDQIKTMKSVGF
ncbi:MAG: hypothetical protein AAFQ80_01640 [Cyanobacteria bacterium J06621_8]